MSGDIEKAPDRVSVDYINDTTKQNYDIDVDEIYTYAEQRKIVHRVDRRLVTMCGLGYCISLMDRTNLSVAAVAGMNVELDLNIGFRYVCAPLLIESSFVFVPFY